MYIGIIISTSIFFSINLNKISVRIILYIITTFITYAINKYMWKIWISKIKSSSLTYKVVINSVDKVKFKVFVDTGNNLTDPFRNLDVIILNSTSYFVKMKRSLLERNTREIVFMDILTATGKSKIKGYIFNNISIMKGGIEKVLLQKAIIVFIDEKINNNEYERNNKL
jgi:hypothetical protein